MRIVSGKYKGRVIVAPKTDATRPTTDKAREAVFNILTHAAWSDAVAGKRVLDLFAGSGALGLEALSRGAEICVFVETASPARGALRTNIEALELQGQARLYKRDATKLGKKSAGVGAPFDLVFLDPPYGKGLAIPALVGLINGGWLAVNAVIMVELGEAEVEAFLPLLPPSLLLQDTRTSSGSTYVFLQFG